MCYSVKSVPNSLSLRLIMRKILFLYILLLLIAGQTQLYAQDPAYMGRENELYGNNGLANANPGTERDTAQVEYKGIKPELYMWTIDEKLGNIKKMPLDTVPHLFQNSNLTDGLDGSYNILGNLGSPRYSRIFFERPDYSQFLFLDPYSFFYVLPQDFKFTNTKSPYTNLTYYKAGGKQDGEERFKAYFSVNVNKKLAFGFNIDYLYGRGFYANQSTSFFNGAFFGSYISDKYDAHLIFSANNLKMAENGGIENDNYILNPLAMSEGKKSYSSKEIPTILSDTWNHNKDMYIFFTHRYNLGFSRDREPVNANDTLNLKEFIPVTSFIHTVNIQKTKRNFISYKEAPKGYYQNTYFSPDSTDDATKRLSVKNTIGISLREGFSKWAKAGLTAFMTYEHRNYSMVDTLTESGKRYDRTYKENLISVGGELAKREGKFLHYNATGEIWLIGEDVGQFDVRGNMDLNFHLWKDTVQLAARAYVKNTNPAFYFRHFHSNHFWWNNDDLSKEFKTRIEGELSVKRWKTRLRAGVENIKNYTFFNSSGLPQQFSENIQIFSATLNQDFKLGVFHLDNEVTYQKSSNNSVIPLPELSLYHNFYIRTKLAKKVLTVELGADMRYFTKYYAQNYSPALGQFYLQNAEKAVEIGGYPVINAYLNLHLKRTRFFVMMSHVNQGMGNSNSFLAPHYPINPRILKLGLSWNFYD